MPIPAGANVEKSRQCATAPVAALNNQVHLASSSFWQDAMRSNSGYNRKQPSVPECRNWQTNRTQNPAHFTGRVGSSPTSGTTIHLAGGLELRVQAQVGILDGRCSAERYGDTGSTAD